MTDGVVAIAMTLLVLDIDVPEGLRGQALVDALDDVQGQVGTFLLSAVVIALFWRAHHLVLRDAEWINGSLFWCNVAFLALVSLIPFPTRVLADYGQQPLGPGLYGAVIGTAALVLYLMAVLVARGSGPRRPSPPFPAQACVFLLSVGIAQYAPMAAVYSWTASVPLSVLAHRRAGRRSRASRP
ncbi:TMEM175 family protein [Streptomyces abyssomicinicus]|uniref:TMEM175 family protein n=1 Tax=Streptomyces abyssomicinicus TaxID=574929 RepID=UPI0013E09796|nr:TMEM175 family protein [Streptomyces abyssomicinicus]